MFKHESISLKCARSKNVLNCWNDKIKINLPRWPMFCGLRRSVRVMPNAHSLTICLQL